MTMEYRHMSTGSLQIPQSSATHCSLPLKHSTPRVTAAMARFDVPRSPPGRQNTSHVPCKFFRAGACQAGNSCPFSHDPASTSDNICKYFAKGNCRFGPKCANAHVLPDGRRVSYTKPMNGNSGNGHVNKGGQINVDQYHSPKSGSALTSSFLRTNGGPPSPYSQQKFTGHLDENFIVGQQGSIDIKISPNDSTYASNHNNYTDDDLKRYGLGSSMPIKVINFPDTPLPASFDSNGISWATRHYSLASSVPSSFGFDAPSDSSGARDVRSSDTLKHLHYSVFGDDPRERVNIRANSPPTQMSDDYLGVKKLNASRSNKMVSSSTSVSKTIDRDWEANFTFEEDYLPETLKDLMTPQEKARRGSRTADDDSRFLHNFNGMPANNETSIKFGSSSNSSPSRWGSLFQRQQQKEDDERARISIFSHVGSPLRKSNFHPVASPKTGPIARPGTMSDSSPFLSPNPRRSSMSIISQQLQDTRLSQSGSNNNDLLLTSSAAVGSRSSERNVLPGYTSNIGSSRNTAQITEEDWEPMMRNEGDELTEKRRSTGGWHSCVSSAENTHFGTIGGSLNDMFSR